MAKRYFLQNETIPQIIGGTLLTNLIITSIRTKIKHFLKKSK